MAALGGVAIAVVRKSFPAVGAAPPVLALEDVKLEVPAGQFLCLTGPSGCGKTTLLNMLAGLDQDFEGHIELPPGRRGGAAVVGYVFQEPRLLPWRTVRENIELVIDGPAGRAETAARLIGQVGLGGFADAYPSRLSLGMARRVALARAFAVEPDLMLLDEPFVSLDEETARRLKALLLELWRSRPVTIICVTHNFDEAIELADRIVVLSASPGHLVKDERVPKRATPGLDRK